MRDHRKLEAFRLADSLILRIYESTRQFPADERFVLVSQLRRAAISVGANIAEGSARPSQTEYIRFLVIAHGSAREIEFELSVAKRLGYLSAPRATELENLTKRTCSALHGLIKALSNPSPQPRALPLSARDSPT
jgi:four helix bundle protein